MYVVSKFRPNSFGLRKVGHLDVLNVPWHELFNGVEKMCIGLNGYVGDEFTSE